MADTEDTKTFDKRVVHRYLKRGVVEDKEYERHLKNLPDLADQAAPVEASIEGDDLDDGGDGAQGGP